MKASKKLVCRKDRQHRTEERKRKRLLLRRRLHRPTQRRSRLSDLPVALITSHAEAMRAINSDVREDNCLLPSLGRRVSLLVKIFIVLKLVGRSAQIFMEITTQGSSLIGLITFTPTIQHYSMATVIGLCLRVKMMRCFPPHFKITGETVGEVKPVANMHQRKAEMSCHSDAFIELPGYILLLSITHLIRFIKPSGFLISFPILGGYGTLEELLVFITWAQLGIHDKPVGLLNVDGYYNSLLTFINKAVDDGFIKPYQRYIIMSAPNAKELVQKLEEYVPVHDGVESKLR